MKKVKARIFDLNESIAGGGYSRSWTDLGEVVIEEPVAEIDPQGEMVHTIVSPVGSRVDAARRFVVGQDVYDVIDQEEDENQEKRKVKITTFRCSKIEEAYIGEMPKFTIPGQRHKKKIKNETTEAIDALEVETEEEPAVAEEKEITDEVNGDSGGK